MQTSKGIEARASTQLIKTLLRVALPRLTCPLLALLALCPCLPIPQDFHDHESGRSVAGEGVIWAQKAGKKVGSALRAHGWYREVEKNIDLLMRLALEFGA